MSAVPSRRSYVRRGSNAQHPRIRVLEAIRLSSNSDEQFKIRQFSDKYFPAAETWYFLNKEFASKENISQNDLIHQITHLAMIPEEANDYITKKMRLRYQLLAVNYHVTRISFNGYLMLRNGKPSKSP